MFELNKKLKIKLIERGTGRYDLAVATGVSETQVSRIMNGHSDGSVDFWRKAADFLDCEIGDIIE